MVSHTVAHYGTGFCTRPKLRGEKHFNSTPTVASFTHRNSGIHIVWEKSRHSNIFEANS